MAPDWRDLLDELVSNPMVKKRIVDQMGIVARTLERWIDGENDPNPVRIRRLLQVVPPDIRKEMLPSLQTEFPRAFDEPDIEEMLSQLKIPQAFYDRVVMTRAQTPAPLAKQTIIGLVLTQMIRQIDIEEMGVVAIVCQCVITKQSDGHVRDLFVNKEMGAGTGAWSERQIEESFYISSGTLAASAVSENRPVYWPRGTLNGEPAPYVLYHEQLKNAAAFPVVLHGGRAAGALFVSAAQEDFFTTSRRDIIKSYANLLALAFREDEFYPASLIDLQSVPTPEAQEDIFGFFRSDFFRSITQTLKQEHPEKGPAQIEKLALEQLRQKLCETEGAVNEG